MFSNRVKKIVIKAKRWEDSFVYVKISLDLPLTTQERGTLLMEDWYRNKVMYTKVMKERGIMNIFCRFLTPKYKRLTPWCIMWSLQEHLYCVCSGNIWNEDDNPDVVYEISGEEEINKFIVNVLKPVIFQKYTVMGRLYEFVEGL